ncbi:hypothetical protein K3495_g1912 [Podosphaera aphanis]|nr:hypothetical protein K3495_g1912 [Podosphaera aphanis]
MPFNLGIHRLVGIRPLITPRIFGVFTARGLKETDRYNPEQAADNERHKQDTLMKQKEGRGHWKPELASDSEEAIMADRNHKGESVEELQKKTADVAEETLQSGTSQGSGHKDDGV